MQRCEYFPDVLYVWKANTVVGSVFQYFITQYVLLNIVLLIHRSVVYLPRNLWEMQSCLYLLYQAFKAEMNVMLVGYAPHPYACEHLPESERCEFCLQRVYTRLCVEVCASSNLLRLQRLNYTCIFQADLYSSIIRAAWHICRLYCPQTCVYSSSRESNKGLRHWEFASLPVLSIQVFVDGTCTDVTHSGEMLQS